MPTTEMTQASNHDKTPSIEIDGLVKQYPRSAVPSVSNFSLTCYSGEIVGLLGHNGAGKSTTLKCMTGMLPYNEGSIKINGYDIKTSPVKAKFTFGFVSDKHDVFVKMTGLQYINFMADAYDVSKELRAERFQKLDELFCLGARLKEPISNYSHGMRQKVCMMGSLIHEPKLWILDEPMIGLDPLTSQKAGRFMKEYAAKGNCIIFSSHNVNAVQKLCDRAVIISRGIKTDDFFISEFDSSKYDLEEYFLSRTAENLTSSDAPQKNGEEAQTDSTSAEVQNTDGINAYAVLPQEKTNCAQQEEAAHFEGQNTAQGDAAQ